MTITRLADQLLVLVALPGIAPEAVQVNLSGDRHLLLSGTAPPPPIPPTHLRELKPGPFQRTIPLPLPVQGALAQPTWVDGRLWLQLRLAGEPLPVDLGADHQGRLA